MSVQLTIHQPGTAREDFFKPAESHEFEQTPIMLGGVEAQCPIPGASENLARIVREGHDFILECLTDEPVVELHGKSMQPGEKHILHSGDHLTICSCPVNFYVRCKKSPVSWQSNAFALLAKWGIAVILVIQLFCICILPKLLNRGRFWSGQQMRLNIIVRTDQLRKDMQAIDNPDPIAKLLLKSYQQDLMQRTTYLRAHSETMTRSQREKMRQALDDLEAQVRFLQTGQLTGSVPLLQIDHPVADIIEKAKHE